MEFSEFWGGGDSTVIRMTEWTSVCPQYSFAIIAMFFSKSYQISSNFQSFGVGEGIELIRMTEWTSVCPRDSFAIFAMLLILLYLIE